MPAGLRRQRREQRRKAAPEDAVLVRAAFQQLGDPSLCYAVDGRLVAVNEPARALVGGVDPFAAWPVRPAGADHPLPAPLCPPARVLGGEKLEELEIEIDCPAEGGGVERRIWRVTGQLVRERRSRQGGTLGAIITVRDITDERAPAAEVSVRAAALEALPASTMLIRAGDGTIAYANRACERLFGYGRGELVDRHVSAIHLPSGASPRERAAEISTDVDRVGRWEGEVETVRHDGERLWTSLRIAPLDDAAGTRLWLAVHCDITEEHERRSERVTSDTRWREAFDAAPMAMAVIGADLRIEQANDRLAQLVGAARDDLVGLSFASLFHREDVAVEAALAARLRRGELPRYSVRKRLLRRSGAVVEVELTVSVARNEVTGTAREVAVLEECG